MTEQLRAPLVVAVLCGIAGTLTDLPVPSAAAFPRPMRDPGGAWAQAAASSLVERTWYDGHRPAKVWMAVDEIAITFEPGRMPASPADAERLVRRREPTAVLDKQVGVVHYFKISDGHAPDEHAAGLRLDPGVRFASPVFYPGDRNPETRMALTGEIVVGFRSAVSDSALAAFASQRGVRLLKALDFSPHTYVFDARDVKDSLDLANDLYLSGQVAFAFPNWIKTATPR